MKITLVQCPAWTTQGAPYALALLAAILKGKGYEVICFDLNIELYQFCKKAVAPDTLTINKESWSMDFKGSVWYEENNVLGFINKYEAYIDSLVDKIITASEKIIGFSVQSTSKFFSLEVARRIKIKDKNKIIVFGGPLCFRNCYGMDILKDFSFLDFVCFGEAEESFLRLINVIEKNGNIDSCTGFGYRSQDGRIIDGGDSNLIESLDSIPFADYSPFSLEKYTENLLSISTSRGCINRCSFCNESPHWKKYRNRSAGNIFEEIKHQLNKRAYIEKFWLNDSLINGNMKMLDEFCDLLILNKIKIRWGGQAMIRKEMRKEFLAKMKMAGCETISYGVESGSNNILNFMRKGYAAELAERIIRDTYSNGINVIFNIIIGFPGENDAEFEVTKKFIRRNIKYVKNVALNMCLLLKDSYLYNNLNEFNICHIDYNSDWQLKWGTGDNTNTYDIRRKRMEELMELLNEKTLYAFS